MAGIQNLNTSLRSITFTTANVLDADAIKTTIATVATEVTYTGAALNGSAANPGPAYPVPDGHTDVPQYPVAVAASNAGSYVALSTVAFVGTWGGAAVIRTATVIGTDGGASFIADGPLDSVTSIVVAAQHDTSGAWTFGFTDIGSWKVHGITCPARQVRAEATGVLSCVDEDGHADLVPFQAYETQTIAPYRIVQSTTTCTSFTVYR